MAAAGFEAALHLVQLKGCLFRRAGAQKGGARLVEPVAAIEPAGRFGHHEGANDEESAGRQRYPEDAAPGMVFEREERAGVAEAGDSVDAIAEVDADKRGSDDAEGEQPLEDAGSFAARRSGKTLGEVEGDDDADEPAAHALEQPAEEERRVSVRERDDGNAEDEGQTAEDHQGLAAHPVGEHTGEEGGENAAEQDRGHDDGELRRIQLGGGFKIGQRAADDAHVDAVEQSAEAGHEKQKEVVALAGAIVRDERVNQEKCWLS